MSNEGSGEVRGPFVPRVLDILDGSQPDVRSFDSQVPGADGIPARILRLPGVYRPQEDTHLIASVLARVNLPHDARVLDFCAGCGALAMAAVRTGATRVAAVDVSARAVVTTWANARIRRLPIRARVGALAAAVSGGPYDVVLANPPYVPCPPGAEGSDRWDAGADGRAVLDPLCAHAPALLAEGGFMLLVQSTVSDAESTLTRLRHARLRADIVARARIPFGPVMRRRSGYLVARGLIGPEQDWDDLVVIRADAPC
ncbi:HemK2/MTQ2 family protein methyltransferase [Rhodococcus sp. UNC363MFTsu5.1]|uniref:HemK2/MTQ2 family protein methyltransferase n=1 Tax=Rhodococcus sp. UNC363MFTsu5.1 TaxID=1449069 RepID=UPI000ADD6837